MKTQLLCTFTTKDELQTSLQEIRTNYKIVYNYIYVLQNKGNLNELFVTYNIDTQYQPSKPLENTILVLVGGGGGGCWKQKLRSKGKYEKEGGEISENCIENWV